MLKTLSLAFAAIYIAAPVLASDVVPYTGPIHKVEPIRMARVLYQGGNRMTMLSPWMPYQASGHRVVGWPAFDGFESDDFGAPTDGRYNNQIFFGSGLGDTFEPGTRWFRGPNWICNLYARGIKDMFVGKAFSESVGIDCSWYTDVTEPFLYAIFTGNTWSDTTAPGLTDFNPGWIFDFGELPGGSAFYSNIDLTGVGTLMMPSATSGGYLGVLCQDFDGQNLFLSTSAQPLQWGTARDNPSQVSDVMFMDGGDAGLGGNGDLSDESPLGQTMIRPTTRRKAPHSYTVTRGVEQGGNDPAKLLNADGNNVVIQQRTQFSPAFPNTEIVAAFTLDGDVNLNDMRTFRVVARMFSNTQVKSHPGCFAEIRAFNWRTNTTDLLDRRKPSDLMADAVARNADFLAGGGEPQNRDYVRTSDRRVEISVRIFHPAPVSPAWTMTVDQLYLLHARSGPLPLCPAMQFSDDMIAPGFMSITSFNVSHSGGLPSSMDIAFSTSPALPNTPFSVKVRGVWYNGTTNGAGQGSLSQVRITGVRIGDEVRVRCGDQTATQIVPNP